MIWGYHYFWKHPIVSNCFTLSKRNFQQCDQTSRRSNSLSQWTLKKSLNGLFFPTKYGIPKSSKVSHCLSKLRKKHKKTLCFFLLASCLGNPPDRLKEYSWPKVPVFVCWRMVEIAGITTWKHMKTYENQIWGDLANKEILTNQHLVKSCWSGESEASKIRRNNQFYGSETNKTIAHHGFTWDDWLV